ncbi:MAG: hypothetical protein Q4E70_03740 [Candidatus Saccharibacteria bacterium]|nr:hypothetical protein [Candidatus Saccharibacteria bacterium]
MKEENIIYRIIDGKGENRRLDKRYVIFGLFIFMVVAVFSFLYSRSIKSASAADLSQFKAGNIISDAVMRNYKSMTESEIQAFLKSKNACNDTNLSKWTAGDKVNYYSETYPPYTWHVSDGHFVCLADEIINGETAAHIIYQAAQDYQINPQVLIVLLQKEQGIITDTFPNSFQYRSATGYGCPDTAACSSTYYGFKNQVRNAASLFNTVLSGGWTNYPVGWNEIRYSPNAACGSSQVYIENLATSALYRYTPYQPNAAALAAGTGSATCGAYGNRNFYIYFTDWFGSTQNVAGYDGNTLYLGEKEAEQTVLAENNKYNVTQYQHGVILGNDETGYFRVKNAAFTKWKDYSDTLGYPTSDWQHNSETGMEWQNFKNGVVVGNDSHGWHVSMGKSRSVWASFNFESGILGWPTSELQENSKTGMRWQNYTGGKIVGNDEKGWFISVGKSAEVWEKHDYESGELGFPTSNLYRNSSTGMEWQNYENGVIVGNDSHGWFISMGKSRSVWAGYGFEGGTLGWPTSDIIKNSETGMEWQNYTGGVIVGNDEKGWFISKGKSREAWSRNGFESGVLGFPTSNLYRNNSTGMEWQYYENGAIVGNDSRGWFISIGASREVWRYRSFEGGVLGWPTSDIIKNSETGMEWQNYTGGVIVGNDENGWFESRGSIRSKWAASGFESGTYGWLKSNIKNGCQEYTGGTICE